MSSDGLRGSSAVSELSREQHSRVIHILESYLGELEEGRPPHPDDLAAEHPELADVLRAYLEKLEVLHHAAAGLRGPNHTEGPAPATLLPARGRLGDFLIQREIGRGGMGIVYEAEQLSLGRRVALKILPFATALDAKQLQRFKTEAQAAAHLHHTNIVPVHAVGCERGVHYYAMQFIEGQTLAAMIADLRHLAGLMPPNSGSSDGGALDMATEAVLSHAPPRAPAPRSDSTAVETGVRQATATLTIRRSTKNPAFFRTAAQLGIQAAEALEHAHQMGVIHRDVKPANLLVDARVHLWITDFGLARCQSDGGVTLTGDLVGTLRYMSPEQALAKRFVVDQRTDIYSLGVTLYELVTLEPAYPGRDRQELLRQIAFEEPRPPRRINPAVPVELETIVLKAMAKEPEGRYATAQELADDLRRFLENKPVLARRPRTRERLYKWAKRHQQVAMVGVVLFLLAVTGLGVHTALMMQEQALTRSALDEAEAKRRVARRMEYEAREKAKEALVQRERAEANFRMSRAVATQLLLKLDDKRWKNIRGIAALRKEVAEEMLSFFQSILREDSRDPAARLEAGWAYMLMGGVCRVQGECGLAEQNYTKAIALFEPLVREFAEDPVYRGELALAYSTLGAYYESTGRRNEATTLFGKATEEYRAALERKATVRVLNNFAWFLCTCPQRAFRDNAQSVTVVKQALARAADWGECWNTLGVAYYRLGHWDESIAALHKSRKMRAGGDGFDWLFLAMAYWQKHDQAEAERWYERAITELEKTNTYMEPIWPYLQEAATLLKKELPQGKERGCGCE
jgi:serine/threonine protein kinase/Tfp pilus assembly protein PilF